jgi:O-antigen ligase
MPELKLLRLPGNLAGAERAAFLALAGAVCLSLVSIAASQIVLAVAVAACIMALRGAGWKLPWRAVYLPLLLFFLWTVLATVVNSGPEPARFHESIKKFYLFLLIPVVPLALRVRGTGTLALRLLFAVAVLSSAAGVIQFVSNPGRDLLNRISGFMSHWMTYTGHLMLVVVALAAYGTVWGWRKNPWAAPLMIALFVPLLLSQTRNTLLGAVLGTALILLLRRPRALLLLALALCLSYLALPDGFRERVRAGWDPNDPNTRNRIELAGTAVRLIGDNPWFGVGPKKVSIEALRYRGTNEFPDWLYQHMHNNFLQIAAERGLPGLALWLWLMLRLAWDALVAYRGAAGASTERGCEGLTVSMAALGCWGALMVSGLFEYNFGDSEVLMLFLFLMSAPYAFDFGEAGTAKEPAMTQRRAANLGNTQS